MSAMKFLKRKLIVIGICLLGLSEGVACAEPNIAKPNILVILIDTVRYDHLGCYGYNRNTSPNIDSIARKGYMYTNFYTVSPWTNPTIASFFTGLYPSAVFEPVPHSDAIKQVLPPNLDTLASMVQKAGYRTIGLVDHPGISRKLNYSRGFDRYVQLSSKRGWHEWRGTEAKYVLEDFKEELNQVDANKHFFVYLHLVYPHRPYAPPAPYDRFFGSSFSEIRESEKDGIVNQYDGELRYTDDLIGNMLSYLRVRNLMKNTVIILTSDHGEGFWEHGFEEHGNTLYNELLRVPLVIYPPGGLSAPGKKVQALTSFLDLFATILDYAGVRGGASGGGISMMRYLGKDGTSSVEKTIFSENPHSRIIHGISSQTDRYKLIYEPGMTFRSALKQMLNGRIFQLYDLAYDPLEKNNIILKNIVSLKMIQDILRHKIGNDEIRKRNYQTQQELGAETIEQLKSLGYLN